MFDCISRLKNSLVDVGERKFKLKGSEMDLDSKYPRKQSLVLTPTDNYNSTKNSNSSLSTITQGIFFTLHSIFF